MSNKITDKQLVEGLLRNEESVIQYVFYEHFDSLLRYNALKVAANKNVQFEDLVQELYLYVSRNGWEKLRRYDVQMPFANWFSVVSYRFFKDYTHSMIDSTQTLPIEDVDDRRVFLQGNNAFSSIVMDIKNAIRKSKPPRDRQILEALVLNEEEPAEVAERFSVTVDNLYNIKRRALAKLIKNHLQDYVTK